MFKDLLILGLILAILGLLWNEARGLTEPKALEAPKVSWEVKYKEKAKWLKPCKKDDSKYYNELVLVCDKSKWKVGGVL